MNLDLSATRPVTAAQYADLLRRTSLGPRRPVDDPARMEAIVSHANLICTAWDGDRLVGVARSLTDFAYCCYLADLAVDEAYQKRGVGKALIRLTQERLDPRANLILLAAPQATEYYPRLGFEGHPSAWLIKAGQALR